MKKRILPMYVLSIINVLSSCKLIKVNYNFTQVDNSYEFILNYSKVEDETKYTNISIKDNEKLSVQKKELIKMMNDVTSCKYGYYNPYKRIIGGDYQTYGVTFKKDNDNVISFSYDTQDIININDKITGKYITFKNSQYKYSQINSFIDKMKEIIKETDESLKEVTIKDYKDEN